MVRERRARRALSGMLRLGLGVGTMVSGESSILEFWVSGICWLVWLLMMLYQKDDSNRFARYGFTVVLELLQVAIYAYLPSISSREHSKAKRPESISHSKNRDG